MGKCFELIERINTRKLCKDYVDVTRLILDYLDNGFITHQNANNIFVNFFQNKPKEVSRETKRKPKEVSRETKRKLDEIMSIPL